MNLMQRAVLHDHQLVRLQACSASCLPTVSAGGSMPLAGQWMVSASGGSFGAFTSTLAWAPKYLCCCAGLALSPWVELTGIFNNKVEQLPT